MATVPVAGKAGVSEEAHNGSPSYPDFVEIELKGKGFTLLRFLSASSSFVINPSKSPKGDAERIVSVRELIGPLIDPFGKEVDIIRIEPSDILLAGNKLFSKKLAVRACDQLDFSPGYIKSGPSVTLPDSLTIFSEKPIPSSVTELQTETMKTGFISRPYFTKVRIVNPGNGLYPDRDSVWLYVPVEKGTEVTLTVPVKGSAELIPQANGNSAAGRDEELFLPSSVTVTCRVPLSRYTSTVPSAFGAVAVKTAVMGDRVLVKVVKAPFWAGNIRWTPTTVHHLTRKTK